jgi:hydrogenase maturation protein HypF
MAAAVLHRLGRGGEIAGRFPGQPQGPRLGQLLDLGLAPQTTSLGRWLDAAAGLLGVRETMAYEGQAAMLLEGLAERHGPALPMAGGWRLEGGRLDLLPLLARLADEPDAPRGAALCHATLVHALADWIAWALDERGQTVIPPPVALGGGCFLNHILTRDLSRLLARQGLAVLVARQAPPNDGGLSLGQAWVAMQRLSIGGY